MRYEARAPLRIDFGGGWTDVPIFASEEGGAVLNAAITRYVRGHISRPTQEGLVRALRGERSYLGYSLNVPAGAGLGASASQTVLWATLVRTTISNTAERSEIAEIAWQIEGLLGVTGGKQDQYASALGGINFLTFSDSVTVDRLELPRTVIDNLAARLVLAYSGQRRFSSVVHEAVWQRYRSGEGEVISALRELRRIATEMRDALVAERLDDFAGLLHNNWGCQKALHSSITTPAIDEILDLALRHGGLAGKACGAGGGGCVLLITRDGEAPRLRRALQQHHVPTIEFDFDTYGVFLKKG